MDLNSVSRQRSRIMGFAMMWIVFFHMTTRPDPGALVYFVHRIGYYGVDIFLLVSGLGLWFSLSKNGSAAQFYKRRLVRIFPAYFIALCVWYGFRKVSPAGFLLSVSTLGYWLRTTHFDWFIPTLVLFYLLAPWYFRLYKRIGNGLLLTACAVGVSAVLCVIAALIGQSDLFGSIVRIPVFCLGFWFGEQCEKGERKVKLLPLFALLLLGLAAAFIVNRDRFGALMQAGLNAWPALAAAPAIAVLLGSVFDFAAAKCGLFGKVLLAPFSFFGRYSLEIYLIHEPLMQLCPKLGQIPALGAALVLAVVLHEAIDLALKALRRNKKPA